MPSFDIVSKLDLHEVTNAVDQTKREVGTRFDFRGIEIAITQTDNEISLSAEADFQLEQLLEILKNKLVKRGIDLGCLESKPMEKSGKLVIQKVILRQGIDSEIAKKITKLIKDSPIKVQPTIQSDQIRVTGKKRDDLQAIIAMLRETKIGLPLQFINFRD